MSGKRAVQIQHPKERNEIQQQFDIAKGGALMVVGIFEIREARAEAQEGQAENADEPQHDAGDREICD